MKEKEQEDTRYYKRILISLILTALLVVIVISLSFSAYMKLNNGGKSKNYINDKNNDINEKDDNNRVIKDKIKDGDSSTKDSNSGTNDRSNTKNNSSSRTGTSGSGTNNRNIFNWWKWILGNNKANNNSSSSSTSSGGSASSSSSSGSSSSTSRISMTYTEATNGISITNAVPTKDEIGMRQAGNGEYFDFTVKTDLSSDMQAIYEIAAIKSNTSTVSNDFIRLYLEEEKNGTYVKSIDPTPYIPIEQQTNVGSPAGSMVLKRVDCSKSGTYNYRLKMWLAENATIDTQKSFSVKINVYGVKK